VVCAVIGGWLVFPDAAGYARADSPADVVVLRDTPGLEGGGGELGGGILSIIIATDIATDIANPVGSTRLRRMTTGKRVRRGLW
jgi:hypothetical protein